MGCFASKNNHQGISIIYNGQVIKLKGEDYNYERLIELVNQRTEKKSSVCQFQVQATRFE
jgi:hypothetical protein